MRRILAFWHGIAAQRHSNLGRWLRGRLEWQAIGNEIEWGAQIAARAIFGLLVWLRGRPWDELLPKATERAKGLFHKCYSRSVAWARVPMDMKFLLQVAEYILWMTGVGCLLACMGGYTAAAWYQSRERGRFEALSQHTINFPTNSDGTAAAAKLRTRNENELWAFGKGLGPLGIIDIPRLGMSSVVEEGDDSGTLLLAVGHVPGTA
ncbi:MAG: hypothetical protein ACREDR_33045, partial [Blastocatellia bacterium]